MKNLSYLEALELRHEELAQECLEVADALKALDEQPPSEERDREIDVKSKELVALGTDKAKIFTMLQEARTKSSN